MNGEFISITEAMKSSGLRLLMIRGVPSPWTHAAKGIFHVKGIEYAKVQLAEGEPREIVREWTGQDAFPAAMLDDERPRTGWEEILWLAERLAPTPSLLPRDPADRALMFGLSRELCGEMGLGWCRRLVGMGAAMRNSANPTLKSMNVKFGSSTEEEAQSQSRVVEIIGLLTQQLARSSSAGNRYFIGKSLTALDIYWATFCNIVCPLPKELLDLPPAMEAIFKATDQETLDAVTPELLAHRDHVYQEFLELPVEL
jgi:glutathione S-transferase